MRSKADPSIEPRWRAHNLPIDTLSRLQNCEPGIELAWHEALSRALDALDEAALKMANYNELSRASGDRLAAQLQTEAQNADRLRTVNMRGRSACNVEIQGAHRGTDSEETAREIRAACKRILASLDEDRQ